MRYVLLILLNIPIVFIALLNIFIRYKMQKMTKERFYKQLLLWFAILTVLIASYPLYNYSIHRPILDSTDLSAFDIAEITVTILLLYIVNDLYHRLNMTERRVRDLHQELSIRLSENNDAKKEPEY